MSEISEADFADVYNYLRGQVRMYGFSEFDMNAAQISVDNVDTTWRLVLQEYLRQFIWYLQVFDPDHIEYVRETFKAHLRGDPWPWERHRFDAIIDSGDNEGLSHQADFPDLSKYFGIDKLKNDFLNLAKEMGLDIPEDHWQPPPEKPVWRGPRN